MSEALWICSSFVLCYLFFHLFYRSRLCGLWRGAHPAQWSVRCLQSYECHQDQKKSGADWHAATKQPAWVWVCTTTSFWILFHYFTTVWIWPFLLFPLHHLDILVWNQTLYIDTAHFVPTDHCMVNFIKKNLLGSLGEFRNRFINPIQNGQCADSTPRDVRIMKKRAHVLYAMLAGCVQVTMRYCRFQAVSARSVLVLYSCPYELVLSSFREEITLSWLSFCLPNMSMCWRWGYPLFSISCTAATWIRSLVRICPHIVAVRKVL